MRKKILVTGGAGYVGSHTVVELYLSGYMPIIVDNLSNTSEINLIGINEILNIDIPFHKLDCTNFEQMDSIFKRYEDIYACVHFAAHKSVKDSFKNSQEYFRNNIGSTEVLLKCLEKNKYKNIIFSSSCTVYGIPDKLPVNEKTFFKKAESPYAETKQKCEFLINDNLCSSISLRYFNAIGSHNSGLIGDCSSNSANNLIPIITEVACGIKDRLVVNGNDYNTPDGTCIRDYLHVEDLAKAHIKALDYLIENNVKEIFNVGTGIGLSVFDIIKSFEKANDVKINYVIGSRRKGDVEKIYCSKNKIENILGWESEKTIEEALISSWNWQKSKNKIDANNKS